MPTVHPKVSGAAFGAMLVTLLVAWLNHTSYPIPTDVVAPFTAVIAALAGWLTPAEYATVDDTFATDEEIAA